MESHAEPPQPTPRPCKLDRQNREPDRNHERSWTRKNKESHPKENHRHAHQEDNDPSCLPPSLKTQRTDGLPLRVFLPSKTPKANDAVDESRRAQHSNTSPNYNRPVSHPTHCDARAHP